MELNLIQLKQMCESNVPYFYEEICDNLGLKQYSPKSSNRKKQMYKLLNHCNYHTDGICYYFEDFFEQSRDLPPNANHLMLYQGMTQEQSHAAGIYIIYNDDAQLMYVGETKDLIKSYLQRLEEQRLNANYLYNLLRLPHTVEMTQFKTIDECQTYYETLEYFVMSKNNMRLVQMKQEYERQIDELLVGVMKCSTRYKLSPRTVLDRLTRMTELPNAIGFMQITGFEMTPELEFVYGKMPEDDKNTDNIPFMQQSIKYVNDKGEEVEDFIDGYNLEQSYDNYTAEECANFKSKYEDLDYSSIPLEERQRLFNQLMEESNREIPF